MHTIYKQTDKPINMPKKKVQNAKFHIYSDIWGLNSVYTLLIKHTGKQMNSIIKNSKTNWTPCLPVCFINNV